MLYALCDYEYLLKNNYSLDEFIKKAKKYRAILVQYRDKRENTNQNIEQKKQNLLYLANKLPNIKIIINDDISLVKYCDGLHLGWEDMLKINSNIQLAYKIINKKLLQNNKLFGLSTHNEQEILQANKMRLSYIGIGAYRQTNTKNNTKIIGEKIKYLCKISKNKVAIIGGVRLDDDIDGATYKCICSNLF